MEEYLNQFKILSDQLALASSPINDEDLVLLILNGLSEEYNAAKATIRTRSDIISFDQLCSLLCSESIHVESSLKHAHASDLPGSIAYTAHRGNHSNREGSRGYYRDRGSFRGRDEDRPREQMSHYQRGSQSRRAKSSYNTYNTYNP